MTDSYLIVGLGNFGREYEQTRHNIGFMAVNHLAHAWGISFHSVEHRAIVGKGSWNDCKLILAKPQTYMNASGEAVGALMRYYKLPPTQLLILYDDLDLPFGALRLRSEGGAGGHNGIKSVIQHVGRAFGRLRLGIGRPAGQLPPAAFVLQPFTAQEQLEVSLMLEASRRATATYLLSGLETAMSQHNYTPTDKQL